MRDLHHIQNEPALLQKIKPLREFCSWTHVVDTSGITNELRGSLSISRQKPVGSFHAFYDLKICVVEMEWSMKWTERKGKGTQKERANWNANSTYNNCIRTRAAGRLHRQRDCA